MIPVLIGAGVAAFLFMGGDDQKASFIPDIKKPRIRKRKKKNGIASNDPEQNKTVAS